MKSIFRKITAIFLSLCMIAGTPGLPITAYAEGFGGEGGLPPLFGPMSVTWEGNGSPGTPYQVSSAEHLADIPNQGMDKHYIQTAEIDLSGIAGWTPIGGGSDAFTGTYDGDGYTISGLKIPSGPQYSGLFYWLGSGGKLMNIGLEGAQITASTEQTSYVGSLVSWNDGTISACYTRNPSVHITQSFSYGGGLVGNNNGTVSDSYSLGGSVINSAYAQIGGLIGKNEVNKTVRNCYSTTSVVSSDGNKGGLIGYGGSPPTSCYYDKDAAGVESGAGTPKTTADMKKISTFSGWDFADTWKLHEDGDYPRLQWEAGWTEGEEINAAWFVLNWNLIRGSNSDQNNVAADLNLPAGGKQGTSISWTASPEGYVNTATGEVTIPSFDEGDQDITLTATVSKGFGTSRSKQFTIKVKAYSADTDIERDLNALTWDSIKGGNSTQSSITANLAALPTAGASGTTISWTAAPSDQSWISIPSGIVTQPTIMQGMQTVTLTAIISKHPGTPRSKVFALTLVPPSVVWIGTGAEDSPYLVSSPDHLFSVRHFLKQDVYFKQTADINLTGMEYNENWLPIGDWAAPFTGYYDGDGHEISNLNISRPSVNEVGLFGFISGGGSVKNLHLTDAVVAGGVNTGILAGIIADSSVSGGGTIENCSAAGTVSGEARVGGLAGAVQQNDAAVRECFSTATVAANPGNSVYQGAAGGLIGFVYSGLVQDSYTKGNVTGGNVTGGFVGEIQGGAMNRCYADGSVAGTSPRGFVGDKAGGTVGACYYNTATGLTDAAATGKSAAELKRRPTFTGWGFDTVWKIGDDASTPSLWWQPWTVSEEITAAKYALTWDDIKGSNSDTGAVTSDLSLPFTGEKGVAVSWSVPVEQLWLTSGGAVTRPAYTEGDQTVFLTAKFNKGGGAEQSKEFFLTIKKLDTPNAGEIVALDHAALTWDVIKNGNASQDAVTGDLLLPGAGAYGSTISWTASPEGTIDVGTGAVSLPAYDEEAVEVTLTAIVNKTGAASPMTRSFALTVKPAAAGDQQAVDDTFDWLIWERIRKENNFENNVKTDLNLIQTGLYGASISWRNNWGARIDPVTGAVTRPSLIQGDSEVTNIATIQKGSATREKTFILTVKRIDPTDYDAVNGVADSLTWNVIKGGNAAQDNVTANLAALPTAGEYDVTVEWTAEPAGQSWVSVPSGQVTRPSLSDGDKTVTLKATIKKGTTERILNFVLTVKASSFARGNGTAQHPYEISNAAELGLVRSFLGAGNSNVYFLQTADLVLSGNWTPIGDASDPFHGKYNGGGHLISGLRVDGSYAQAGLFGATWGPAVLENIRLTGIYIRSNTSSIQSLGGLCGNNRGTVKNCSAEGEVLAVYGTVQARAGVLIGYNAGTVEHCFSTGSASIAGVSATYAGGLMGRNDGGTVRECYSRASAYAGGINGSSGGLVGNNSGGSVQISYSTGRVTGDGTDHTEGGLVGYQSGGSTSDSFYNRETSGKSDNGKGTPKTTVEMKQQETFSDWDFTADTGVWRMMETFTYPLLQWQPLTADEIITVDTAALSWAAIKGANSAENNVMTDLSLPSSGTSGASITWEASPAGYIDTSDGKVTRPNDADKTVSLTARVNRSGGTEQTKTFALTIKLLPIAPTITGPAVLTLTEGYAATSTGVYTITGTAPVTVTKTSGNAKITWNDSAKKLDIAAGLAAGSYPVTLKAANGILPDATLTFTLTVEVLVNAQTPVIMNNLTDQTTYEGAPVTLDATAAVTDGGTLTYAWYSNTARSMEGATALGVTTAAYSPAVSAVGTTYYYCVVTNTNNAVSGTTTAAITSAVARVRVTPVPAAVTGVAVNPAAVTVQKGTAYQFGATVSGTNNPSQSVTWGVSGQSDGGTFISLSGLLTVAAGETEETLTVTAISTADSTKSGTATVTVTDAAPPVPVVTFVTVTPDIITLYKGGSHTFSAAVNGTGNPSQGVTWTVEGGNGETAIAADGKLTVAMNETAAAVIVRAASAIDGTKSGTAAVTLLQPVPTAYTVTFDANGGSVLPAHMETGTDGKLTSLPVPSRSNHRFDGWFTAVSPGSAITVNTVFTDDVTVYAQWTYTGGSPGSAYDENSGSIIFPTGHFSIYGVGYGALSGKFTDIGAHWAKESIDYVAELGLFGGTTETTFSPNRTMDRGMLVTVLGRLSGADMSAYKTSSFTDVASGKYYRPYIEWAYRNGVVNGIGGGRFAPERGVTREEIALILQNYAKTSGYGLPETRDPAAYADDSRIGGAYRAAVAAMQQAGIMTGGSGNKFNPKAGATRAEVAVILHRYLKLTIDGHEADAEGTPKTE